MYRWSGAEFWSVPRGSGKRIWRSQVGQRAESQEPQLTGGQTSAKGPRWTKDQCPDPGEAPQGSGAHAPLSDATVGMDLADPVTMRGSGPHPDGLWLAAQQAWPRVIPNRLSLVYRSPLTTDRRLTARCSGGREPGSRAPPCCALSPSPSQAMKGSHREAAQDSGSRPHHFVHWGLPRQGQSLWAGPSGWPSLSLGSPHCAHQPSC